MQELDVMTLESFRHFGGVVKKSTKVLKKRYLDYEEYVCEATYNGEEGYVCYATYGTNERNTREYIIRHMRKERYLKNQPGKNLYNSIEKDIFGDNGRIANLALSEEEIKMVANNLWISEEQQNSYKLNLVWKCIALTALASCGIVGFNIVNIAITIIALYKAFTESIQFTVIPYIEGKDGVKFFQDLNYEALLDVINEEKKKTKRESSYE